MTIELSLAELALIQEEEAMLRCVLFALQLQQADHTRRLTLETARARTLTHELVASRKFEEKVSLGDQERLSHALKERSQEEVERLINLLNKPYFARVIIEEESDDGVVEREFKIGHNPNSDCRIIDWKRAPLSKLYYHYKEGEEFAEEIQGVDRYGVIKLRRQVEIENGVLRRIIDSTGTFLKVEDRWIRCSEDVSHSPRPQTASSHLPDVLSLISLEQFDTITREARDPVLIQGIAGSGKTTVALYRAAWLLNEYHEDLSQERSAIVVLNPLLRSYIRNSLRKLNLPAVKVFTIDEWVPFTMGLSDFKGKLKLRSNTPNYLKDELIGIKTEFFPLSNLSKLIATYQFSTGGEEDEFLDEAFKLIGETFEDRLKELTSEKEANIVTAESLVKGINYYQNLTISDADINDLSLVLWIQLEAARLGKSIPFLPRSYDILIADEAQDLHQIQLSCVALASNEPKGLTLVGDIAQQTEGDTNEAERSKGVNLWERLNIIEGSSSPLIQLTVPYRCTLPIMKFAAACRGDKPPSEGRSGPRPLWVRCKKEEIGHAHIITWLTNILKSHSGALCSVLCASRDEARLATSLLKPAFGNLVELADPTSFTLDEGILVSDIQLAKGLEFSSVLLWNPSKKRLPDSQTSANLLYVAATRAQDELCVISWDQPSPCLPGFHSPLVDGYTMESEQSVELRNDDYR